MMAASMHAHRASQAARSREQVTADDGTARSANWCWKHAKAASCAPKEDKASDAVPLRFGRKIAEDVEAEAAARSNLRWGSSCKERGRQTSPPPLLRIV